MSGRRYGPRWPPTAGLPANKYLSEALLAAAGAHNQLALTAPVPATMRPFWARPYLVPDSGRFTAALRETIQDPAIRALPLAGAAALRAAVAALLHPGTSSAR